MRRDYFLLRDSLYRLTASACGAVFSAQSPQSSFFGSAQSLQSFSSAITAGVGLSQQSILGASAEIDWIAGVVSFIGAGADMLLKAIAIAVSARMAAAGIANFFMIAFLSVLNLGFDLKVPV